MLIAAKFFVGVAAIFFGCLQVYFVFAKLPSVIVGGLELTPPIVQAAGSVSTVILCILYFPEIIAFIRSRFG